eukprot:GDKH01020038.1.p1 GENE.GDKH01020038.1~~GDKH01020038.1.p1  ORF type:complete len:113 (-),score=12.08 GDKH01020038.1:127-465(-)
MVKATELKKSELVDLLHTAETSKQKNKVVKLLKKFDANPRKELDAENDTRHLKVKQYQMLQHFICWRCDKVKQSNMKVHWSTTKGSKIICVACYHALKDAFDLKQMKKEYGI